MTVQLPIDLADFVRGKVESGEYASEQDLLINAVHVLRELNRKHEQLRRDIQIGIDQLNSGEGRPLDIDRIKSEGMKRLAERNR